MTTVNKDEQIKIDSSNKQNQVGKLFTLTITKISDTECPIMSTDSSFSIDNLAAGINYRPNNVFFLINGERITRNNLEEDKQEISNYTIPRLTCQVFEGELKKLSDDERKYFPVCQYTKGGPIIRGLFSSEEEFERVYPGGYPRVEVDNTPYVLHSYTVFSTILFVQECLRRWGKKDDQFVLEYQEKTEEKKNDDRKKYKKTIESTVNCKPKDWKTVKLSEILRNSKNIILRGAPGTGKSYLAKAIAANIITEEQKDKSDNSKDEKKEQVEFVQFHPNYDYSDFVEGLRPKMNEDGSMGFELQDGIFKRFVDKARKNYENSIKSSDLAKGENSAKFALTEFFKNIEFGKEKFETISGSKFLITNVVDDRYIEISVPDNPEINKLTLNIDDLQSMLKSDNSFNSVSDITKFFGKQFSTQAYSYYLAIYKKIIVLNEKEREKSDQHEEFSSEEEKKYIFIIDEINRGEISKILGELFYTIDPGYRGKSGEVSTQYSNMHSDPSEKFYIPENVYIIGTMNDIDRSVDSFDFAMRRRFRFIEIKAEETMYMLDSLDKKEVAEEAKKRMKMLNEEISNTPDLNENYQIGAAYFLKLKDLDFDFDKLWSDYLEPLLQEYVRGLANEKSLMEEFEKAYSGKKAGTSDESTK